MKGQALLAIGIIVVAGVLAVGISSITFPPTTVNNITNNFTLDNGTAEQIINGTFGANVGNGQYIFPDNITVNKTIWGRDSITIQADETLTDATFTLNATSQIYGSALNEVRFMAAPSVNFTSLLGDTSVRFTANSVDLLPDKIDTFLFVGNENATINANDFGSVTFVRSKMLHGQDLGLLQPVVYNFNGFQTIIYPTFSAVTRFVINQSLGLLSTYSVFFGDNKWQNEDHTNISHDGFISGFRVVNGFRTSGGEVNISRLFGIWSEPKIKNSPLGGKINVTELNAYVTWRGFLFGLPPFSRGNITTLSHYKASNPKDDPFGQELLVAGLGEITTQIGYLVSDMTQGVTRIGFKSDMTEGDDKWNMQMGTAMSYHEGNISVGTTAEPISKLYIAGNVTPTVDGAFDLGTTSRKWGTLHAKATNIGDIREDYTFNHGYIYEIGDLICIDVAGINETKPCSSVGEKAVVGVVAGLPFYDIRTTIRKETIYVSKTVANPKYDNLTKAEYESRVIDDMTIIIQVPKEIDVQDTEEYYHDMLEISIFGKHIVKVTGKVTKGDLLIASSTSKMAISLDEHIKSSPLWLSSVPYLEGKIVGRALESYNSPSTGVILAFIGGQ